RTNSQDPTNTIGAVVRIQPDGSIPAETGTPEPEPLGPPVQQGPPNASGQTPAFPEQTRAPQPAELSAFDVETVTSSLNRPWGLTTLPDGRLLVNQKGGNMVIVTTSGQVSSAISGVPSVNSSGQGGLLDVAIDPDFANNRYVYWSFSEPRNPGSSTSVARGVLSAQDDALTDVEVIFQQEPVWFGAGHYGSRLAFAPDGNLFITTGDRQDSSIRTNSQDPTNTIGAVVRIQPDGSIPATGNPFASNNTGDDALWSYGHRNLQSAAIDLQGRLWTVEHGPRGGDELNRPEAGKNYGWPVVTYGEDYDGQPLGDGITELAGTEQPVYYWDPVIAPAGMEVYDGPLFDWQGDFLVCGLQAQALVRLTMRNDQVYTEEWLPLGTRCRDVAVADDGSVYVATDDVRILRLTPTAP
ncbi:MAG: PQQ-dependent sugar dehydrogenase, partial [Myxococcota bacterium]